MDVLTPQQACDLDLTGRSFLHQQGRTVCRGVVESLAIEDGQWQLQVRDVEYLDRDTRQWVLKRSQDTYDSMLGDSGFYLYPDGRLEISGYGMVVHVAPAVADPWMAYDWPSTDGYPGGPMAK